MSNTAKLSMFDVGAHFKSLYTRPSGHLAALDGLRALSILLTLLFHGFFVYKLSQFLTASMDSMAERLGSGWIWIFNGDKGVDVFFVLSGFLISGILFKEYNTTDTLQLKRFYLRRYLRLTPAYYLALSLYWLGNGPNSDMLWANYLYLNNFIDYERQAMGWTWSLAIEEQFYLLYPLILILIFRYFKSPLNGLWLLMGLSIMLISMVVLNDSLLMRHPASFLVDKTFFMHIFSVLYDNLHTRFGSLLAGCIAAYFYYFKYDASKTFFNHSWAQWLTLLGLLLVMLILRFPIFSHRYDEMQTLHIVYYIVNRYVFSIGIAIVIMATLLQNKGFGYWLNWLLSWRLWIPLARLSYSIYLIHLMVMAIVIPALAEMVKHSPQLYPYSMSEVILIGTLIGSMISILLALIIYLLVEKPMMSVRT